MALKINIMPHPDCPKYLEWSEYLKSDNPSSVSVLSEKNNFNSTAKNLINRCKSKGYTAKVMTWAERNEHLDDIYEINTSLSERQGKRMDEYYFKYPREFTNTDDKCDYHYSKFIGVFKGNKLVGYISANFFGEAAAASQIIGHGNYLEDGIMYLLWSLFEEYCRFIGIKYIIYSRWSDGTDGLRTWKHAVGMQPIILKEK